MKSPIIIAAIFTATSLIAGCATSQYGSGIDLCDSQISQMGKDTYMAEDRCNGSYEIHDAGVFCGRMGKQILVTNTNRASPQVHSTVFQCLSPNAAQSRPDYQRPPDIVIQDNRK